MRKLYGTIAAKTVILDISVIELLQRMVNLFHEGINPLTTTNSMQYISVIPLRALP